MTNICLKKHKYIILVNKYIHLDMESDECSCSELSVSMLASTNTQILLVASTAATQPMKDTCIKNPCPQHK